MRERKEKHHWNLIGSFPFSKSKPFFFAQFFVRCDVFTHAKHDHIFMFIQRQWRADSVMTAHFDVQRKEERIEKNWMKKKCTV